AMLAKQLLDDLIRKNTPNIAQSQLLQNYPNPFNPETWLPFRLSKPSEVTIGIYTPSGQLVKKIELGYRDIGDYSGRDSAIHWDGRNESGEEVSSGMYFYSINAGEFHATKKMIVKK
ncbi:MAG: FlgD immunoglobulin-like domain containing protein, partial [Candidatus Poribacteria bacterium]